MNVQNVYLESVAFGHRVERDYWGFGDVLLKECGPPPEADAPHDGSRQRIAECAAAMREDGLEFEVEYLAMLRVVAFKFPPDRRHLDLAHSTHRVAGNPDFLDAVIAGAPEGQRVSPNYVEDVRQGDRVRQKLERAAALAEAKAAEAAAKEAVKAAKIKRRAAQTDAERWAAEAEANAAAERAEEAREAKQKSKIAPKRGHHRAPEPEDVPQIVGELQASKFAKQAKKLAKDAAKAVRQRLHKLSPVTIAALTEEGLEVANAWNDFANTVRRATIHKREHLHAVNE